MSGAPNPNDVQIKAWAAEAIQVVSGWMAGTGDDGRDLDRDMAEVVRKIFAAAHLTAVPPQAISSTAEYEENTNDNISEGLISLADGQRQMPRLSDEELADALRNSPPDAPLLERLRHPPSPYNPAKLRLEAAAQIERLHMLLKRRSVNFQKTIVKAERRAGAQGLEIAANICNQRGIEEQKNFGLGREAQNYFRARDAIRATIPVVLGPTKPQRRVLFPDVAVATPTRQEGK